MQPLIELQDLTHTYTDAENNQVLALQKINLQIRLVIISVFYSAVLLKIMKH